MRIRYKAIEDPKHGIIVGYHRPHRAEFVTCATGFGRMEAAEEEATRLNAEIDAMQEKLERELCGAPGERRLANWYDERDVK